MGRKKTTGNLNTRAELEETVWCLWRNTACGIATIARHCRISEITAHDIINNTPCPHTVKEAVPYSGINERHTLNY